MTSGETGLPPPPAQGAAWGGAAVLLVFAVGFLSGGILIGLVQLLVGGKPAAWQAAAAQFGAFGVWWILGRLIARLTDPRGTAALGLGPRAFRGLLDGVAWYVPLGLVWWGLMLVYQLVLGLLAVEMPQQSLAKAFLEPGLEWLPLAVLILAPAVGAPIGEEMVFRGLAHGWIRRYFGLPATAVIVGTFFGLCHVEPGQGARTLLFVPPLALLGIMLAWVRERPCGLWGAIGAHAAHNSTTLFLLWSSG